VTADFTTLTLDDVGDNRVSVSGVTGTPRPEKLKLNLGRLEGYMRELIFTVGYPRAWDKLEQLKQMIEATWEGLPIKRLEYYLLGLNSLYGTVVELPDDPMELAVRVMFTAEDEKTLKMVVRKMMQNGLSGPAGMSISGSTISARPRIILGLFPTLIDRDLIQPHVDYLEV
ncbi:MAG: acyclic terpene utilization AtuA family protein, partial [Aggregatilineales bacterium]